MQTDETVNFGATLPISRGEGGYFATNTSAVAQMRSNIAMLFSTRRGERRMSDFGTTLHAAIFDMSSEETLVHMENIARSDIQTNLPYITVESITATFSDGNDSAVRMQIQFTAQPAGIYDTQTADINITV